MNTRYGAGAEKIGSIINGTKKEGTSLKKKFFDNTPAMKLLTDAVKQAAERRGWVKGIDGRRIPVRSAHSALNFLLQGAGAIVCKMWMNEFHRLLKENGYIDGLHYKQSAWVHDELQIAFNPEFITGEIMGKLSDDAIKNVGKELKMNIELASDWSVGDTYADTH